MATPYKRRKSTSLIRNFWVYRRLILAAILLGLTLWFILINNTAVTIYFPFRLGKIETTSGIALLLGVLTGSITTALVGTVFLTVRRYKQGGAQADDIDPTALPEERPPTDYAAKTGEGFSDAPWKAR